jgi:thiamine-monophosphate kinase
MDPKILDLVLGGGDDYELLFTADASFETMSKSVVSEVGVALTKIGTITKGTAIRLFYENGSEHRIDQTGFTHF